MVSYFLIKILLVVTVYYHDIWMNFTCLKLVLIATYSQEWTAIIMIEQYAWVRDADIIFDQFLCIL